MSGLKDICQGFFDVRHHTDRRLQAGSLLIAEPFLEEDCFTRSVISLIDYEPSGGAMGVVLNHRAQTDLAELLNDSDLTANIPVYIGGPLATDRLFFLHSLGDDIIPGSRPYIPGVYVGGDFNTMIEMVRSGYNLRGSVRFFVGYSCWERGQLETEIADGTWAVDDAPAADPSWLFRHSGDRQWHEAVRRLGSDFRPWLMVPSMTCAN